MDDTAISAALLLVLVVILASIVLPIVALAVSIRSRRKLNEKLARLQSDGSLSPPAIAQLRVNDLAPLARTLQQLERRTEAIETALIAEGIMPPTSPVEPLQPASVPPAPPPPKPSATAPPSAAPPATQAQPFTSAAVPPARKVQAAQIESMIGRRWLGWVAVLLILFATAFFLKYAFDNRWIGELGRVTIGIIAGLSLTALGLKYYNRGWRIFSQILTAGGVVLLYLSVYAAFGYYHLATQKAAFTYLVILVAEAAGLALLYDAPAIATMALLGGFLAPVLLHSDRDQYKSLFAYLAVLDIGALALLRHWVGVTAVAFAGTHLLFWLWYGEHYHPRKLAAVMIFQLTVFLIFLLRQLLRRIVRPEPLATEPSVFSHPLLFSKAVTDLGLLLLTPFVFFATSYLLLDANHHDWMGAFALGLALVYAVAAKVLMDRHAGRNHVLIMVGIALTFVTLAIPIQLHAIWSRFAGALEALTMLWAGIQIPSTRLQITAGGLFLLSLGKLVLADTSRAFRPQFTPVLNKYFLSSLAVIACLFAAAALIKRAGERKQMWAARLDLVCVLLAVATLWFVSSIEIFTYFHSRADAFLPVADRRHELWLGQMAMSVMWSLYAAILMAIGFVRRSPALRWAALSLFGLTVVKVMLVDIAVLQQLYRIIAFFVLGLLLLVVAWGYHRAFHAKESSE